jgi:4'-phosphopantetheinyl transferase
VVGETVVGYVFVSLAREAAARDYALLDDRERGRAATFVHDRDRNRFVVAHAALRSFLAHELALDPEEVRYERTAEGKPHLAQGLPPIEFNLSHAGDFALLAAARGVSIGVDIELVRELPDADAVADDVFSITEREVLRSLPAQERRAAFFRCWTRKEAIVKALGKGLGQPLDSFSVDPAAAAAGTVVSIDGRTGGWSLHDLSAPAGYAAAGAAAVGSAGERHSWCGVPMPKLGE